MKISVCVSTRRYNGLFKQIELFSYQTFPKQDFELIIIDGLYWQREQQALQIATQYGLNIIYKKPRKLSRKVSMDHAAMRNDALTYATGELIVFFDDYQIPDEKLLEEHWRIYKQGYCCQGRQFYFKATDFDNIKEMQLIKSGNMQLGDHERNVPAWVFYTHNCSAPLREIINVNGFDERYNSGTGGEDYNLGTRLGLIGNKTIYNPKALCYHMDHTGIEIYPACPTICNYIGTAKNKDDFLKKYPTVNDMQWIDWTNLSKYKLENHDRSPIYKHPNFTGTFSTETLDTWDETGLIFCRCKICGWEGIIDSMPLSHWNVEHKIIESPKEYFDLKFERQKIAEKS